jgi:hypothetical protein
VTAVDDDWEEDGPYEPDDPDEQYEPDHDDDDPGGSWEPDPEDAEIARAYYEEAEHRDEIHGGGDCTCRPSLAEAASQLAGDTACRLRGIRNRLTAAARRPYTVRAGPAEVTIRLRADRRCGACGGRGWSYSLIPGRPDLRPPGYNDVGLCRCGSAIGQLAESRRAVRRAWDEPPF